MAKKSRKQSQEFKFDPYDNFDDIYDDDFDVKDLSKDFYSTEWGESSENLGRSSARRKIERRAEMKRLYSELNDWEEFGETDNWY